MLIEKMDSRSPVFEPGRYDTFVLINNPTISFPDEYYNGANESSTDNPLPLILPVLITGSPFPFPLPFSLPPPPPHPIISITIKTNVLRKKK